MASRKPLFDVMLCSGVKKRELEARLHELRSSLIQTQRELEAGNRELEKLQNDKLRCKGDLDKTQTEITSLEHALEVKIGQRVDAMRAKIVAEIAHVKVTALMRFSSISMGLTRTSTENCV